MPKNIIFPNSPKYSTVSSERENKKSKRSTVTIQLHTIQSLAGSLTWSAYQKNIASTNKAG